MSDRYITANSISDAWLGALAATYADPTRKLVHLVIRILDPTAEDLAVRAAAQGLIDDWNARRSGADQLYDIETTRNTVFPAAWAARHPEPVDLAEHYRGHYTKNGLLGFRHNDRGTYFGRIVAYPRPDDPEMVDQLTTTVEKLRKELRPSKKTGRASNKSSRYEVNVYSARHDRSPMSFPCLAHISVHLHERRLHMQAVYRNEFMIARAYGNYLGLAELQAYIAEAAHIGVGELLMTVNHAELETGGKRAAGQVLREFGLR